MVRLEIRAGEYSCPSGKDYRNVEQITSTMPVNMEKPAQIVGNHLKITHQKCRKKFKPIFFDSENYVAGFLLCIKGANLGTTYAIRNGISTVGSDPNMDVYIKVDTRIERENQLVLFYDDSSGMTYLKGISSQDMIYVDDKALYDTEVIEHLQTIQIGKTYLKFLAFCGSEFTWGQTGNSNQ